ncbi:MAG: hypothetical protein ACR2N3_12310 [Pyrinomonadaceae bacterium]
MDNDRTQTIDRPQNAGSFVNFADNDSGEEGLNALLAANAEIAREKTLFQNYGEQFEASLMKNPLTTEKAFAYFGLLLGIFPPASIFLKMFHKNIEPGIVVLFVFVNLVCAVAGYFSGKLIGRMARAVENYSWNKMLLLLPLIGILWGIIAGGIGGIFIFVIGAIFGAFIAALVGSVAVPAFTIFHRLLKCGEMIERKHFLPLAFGITFIVSAFIFGL